MLVLSGLGHWYHKVRNTRGKEQNLPFIVLPTLGESLPSSSSNCSERSSGLGLEQSSGLGIGALVLVPSHITVRLGGKVQVECAKMRIVC